MFSFFGSLFAQETNKKFKKPERVIKRLIRKKQIPGLAITVVKNGEIEWSQGYGYANIKKKIEVKPDATIFRIGSVSKPISAVGLYHMVKDSLIDLETSVHNYLPYFPKKQYDFSIKQAGTHQSGIRNYKGNEFKNNKPLSIREGVALFENDSLLFEPGTQHAYTSYNWNLISLVMQEVSGVPFEAFIQEKVLDTFKMTNTFADTQQEIENKAIFYRKAGKKRFKPVGKVHNFFKLAGGGYLSTSEDVAKFGQALLDGTDIDQEQFKPFITSESIGERLTYYGIGFQVSFDHTGRPYFGHVGNGLGGYGIFYVYPEDEVVLSILMNCSNPEQDESFKEIIEGIFNAF